MGYRLTYQATISYVPDGVGPMGVPGSPSLRFNGVNGIVVVPGGNSPSGANITTALSSAATDLSNQMTAAAVLANIQAWATGGPYGYQPANG